MALTLGYPRCYSTGNIMALPYTCGPNKGLMFARLHEDAQRLPITGWNGLVPITTAPGFSDGAYEFEEGVIYGEVPADQDQGGFWDTWKRGIGRLLGLADKGLTASEKATNAAKVGGYAAIALVGAGLLVWYVPRKKR